MVAAAKRLSANGLVGVPCAQYAQRTGKAVRVAGGKIAMSQETSVFRAQWRKPELLFLGELSDVAGSPAPLVQINPGGNIPTAGKS